MSWPILSAWHQGWGMGSLGCPWLSYGVLPSPSLKFSCSTALRVRAEGSGSLGGRKGCSGETLEQRVRLGPIFLKGEVLVKHKSEWDRPLLKASDGCHLVHSQSQLLAGPSRPCLSEPISSLASFPPLCSPAPILLSAAPPKRQVCSHLRALVVTVPLT